VHESREFFLGESRTFYKFLDWSKALVYGPDERKIHNIFDSPKWQIEKVDQLVKNGEMDLGVARELRLRIERPAWDEILEYVRNSWDTSDGLARVRAVFRRRLGHELESPNGGEGIRRKEALRKFSDVLFAIVTLHQLRFRLDDGSSTGIGEARSGDFHDNQNY
jgi:hypothetical protein